MENINEFISNREIAIAFWGLVFIVFILMKNKAFVSSFHNVLDALVEAKYALLILVIAPTIITIVVLSRFISIDYTVYKDILIWMASSIFIRKKI